MVCIWIFKKLVKGQWYSIRHSSTFTMLPEFHCRTWSAAVVAPTSNAPFPVPVFQHAAGMLPARKENAYNDQQWQQKTLHNYDYDVLSDILKKNFLTEKFSWVTFYVISEIEKL